MPPHVFSQEETVLVGGGGGSSLKAGDPTEKGPVYPEQVSDWDPEGLHFV